MRPRELVALIWARGHGNYFPSLGKSGVLLINDWERIPPDIPFIENR
jgi:hypothetical protein